uniref:Uncharacterized protein n=1 Tax=Solanum tuberosum TaxID=4113 RepID=M1DG09_SOLTU
MLNVLLKSVTFGEKPKVAEGTRRLAESLLDRPLSAPLIAEAIRKTTIRDPNVPSWAWGFCAAVHVFLEDSHVTDPSGPGTAIPLEITFVGLELAFEASKVSLRFFGNGENQVGNRKKQSACRRIVPRCSTPSPNVTKLEVTEGQCRKAMNQTKGQIAEWIGDPD